MIAPRLSLLCAALLACGPQVDPPLELPPAPPSRSPITRDDPGVHHDDFARAVLYTWTTPAQIDALRASRRLLVAEAHHGDEVSPFLRALDDLVTRRAPGHDIAAVLRDHPGLARRRYAWVSPLATTLGLGARRYGDALIRIDLAPTAHILAFRPADPDPFKLVDMSGKTVPLDALEPHTLAAVYHIRDAPADAVPFREYVVVNEAQIAGWSIATPELRARVDADLALLAGFTRDFTHLPEPAIRSPAAPVWATAPATPTPLDRWHALLAFDNDRYRPTPANLAAIADALRQYTAAGEPLVHRPAVTFPEEQVTARP